MHAAFINTTTYDHKQNGLSQKSETAHFVYISEKYNYFAFNISTVSPPLVGYCRCHTTKEYKHHLQILSGL